MSRSLFTAISIFSSGDKAVCRPVGQSSVLGVTRRNALRHAFCDTSLAPLPHILAIHRKMLWVDDVRNYIEPHRPRFSKTLLHSIDPKLLMGSIITSDYRNA